ncbi:hypothetical protein [Rhodococcus sp. NPDC003383]
MTKTLTNRHGDEIAVGQLWTDDPRRTTVRTLRIDDLVREGNLGSRAVCTVIRSHDTETGQVTEPGRVVSINIDSLHTTASGRGYRLEVDAELAPGV